MRRRLRAGIAPAKSFFFSVIFMLLSSASSLAADLQTVITSDSLEYFSAEKKYVASGSVAIERGGAVIHADKATYYESTSEVEASGHFTYDDEKYTARADKAEMNMDAQTGRLYDAEVLYRKENYHLSGREIERRGEDYYYSPEGSFTTCDAPVPAWCFKGRDINARVGEAVKTRDSSFLIKDLPVFYAPYLWTSLITDRQTGFLMPMVGHSGDRGFEFGLPFYWAIAENRDATFVLDYYSKRGVGSGLEYRFIEPGGIKNTLWAYHIWDTELHKDDVEVKELYDNRHPGLAGGYLNINFVNESDYYREFNPEREIRTQRFLESTAEISMPFSDSRLYFLSQYWVDLENPTGNVPQRLPEAGYVLNYTSAGSFMYSLSATADDFWRKDGISAGRFDVYPKVINSFGKDFVVTQAVAVRGTSYAFYNQAEDGSSERGGVEYDLVGHTRLYRDYGSFTHVMEPSIGYHFISPSESGLPVFDETEFFTKTSTISLSLLNRAIVKGSEIIAVRMTQAFDTYVKDRPFLPFEVELAMRRFIPLAFGASYNLYNGELETVSSDMTFSIAKATVSVGERYNRTEDIMMFTAAAKFSPYRSLQTMAQVWYDAKGAGLQDLTVSVKYLRQCWGVRIEAIKKPGDFTMRVVFDLAGLSSSARGEAAPSPQHTYF